MNPEKLQSLRACLQEAGSILYEETPTEELQSLEDIEKAVRQHILQHIGPEMGYFLSALLLGQLKADNDSSKAVLDS